MTDFLFEFMGTDSANFKRGDVVSVVEQKTALDDRHRTRRSRSGSSPRPRPGALGTPIEYSTSSARTNYSLITNVPPDTDIDVVRQFTAPIFDEVPAGKEEDPHSGGVLHERRWYNKSMIGTQERFNSTMTWDELLANLTDKETGLSASQVLADKIPGARG